MFINCSEDNGNNPPDGNTVDSLNGILFCAKQGGLDVYLYYYDMDNQELNQLTNSGRTGNPAWSYNRTRIAYEYYETSQYDICLRYPDSSNSINLTQSEDRDEQNPSWCPGDSALAYVIRNHSSGTNCIVFHHLSSHRTDTIFVSSQAISHLAVSPMGNYLCYLTSSLFPSVHLINTHNHLEENIDLYSGINWFSWNHTGTMVTAAMDTFLLVTPIYGMSNILDQGYSIFDYCEFTPNDSAVVYSKEDFSSNYADLYMFYIFSGDRLTITENADSLYKYRALAFSPDGTRLAFAQKDNSGNTSIGVISLQSREKSYLATGFSSVNTHDMDW